MLARRSHAAVKAFMFPVRKARYLTWYEDLWRALDHFGVRHEKTIHKFESWDAIPATAIVGVVWRNRRRSAHWVIFQKLPAGFRVIDPASSGETLTMLDVDRVKAEDYSLVTPRLHARSTARAQKKGATRLQSRSRRGPRAPRSA